MIIKLLKQRETLNKVLLVCLAINQCLQRGNSSLKYIKTKFRFANYFLKPCHEIRTKFWVYCVFLTKVSIVRPNTTMQI